MYLWSLAAVDVLTYTTWQMYYGGTCCCSTCTYYENSVPVFFFCKKCTHKLHWYNGTGVLVLPYLCIGFREQPYVRIRTKLHLPTSWCAMARTTGTSRVLTFVPVPCILVVLRTVSHWFACVHVIRGFCHYRRTWCCWESGMLRPTRSWTSRAEAVAAKDKCLRIGSSGILCSGKGCRTQWLSS